MSLAVTMVVLLAAFFALYGVVPRRGLMLRVYVGLVSFLASSIVLLHYLSLLSQPVKVRVLPFLIVEEYGAYRVLALDWGQIVLLMFLITLYGLHKAGYLAVRRSSEVDETTTTEPINDIAGAPRGEGIPTAGVQLEKNRTAGKERVERQD